MCEDIKTWITSDFLLLNIVLDSTKMVSYQILTLDDVTLASINTVRIDQFMSSTAFLHLHNSLKIRNILSQNDA